MPPFGQLERNPVKTPTPTATLEAPQTTTRLTKNQVRSFWAAWGGWTMDGMDSFIYSLVLVPALRNCCRAREFLRPRLTLVFTAACCLPCS